MNITECGKNWGKTQKIPENLGETCGKLGGPRKILGKFGNNWEKLERELEKTGKNWKMFLGKNQIDFWENWGKNWERLERSEISSITLEKRNFQYNTGN